MKRTMRVAYVLLLLSVPAALTLGWILAAGLGRAHAQATGDDTNCTSTAIVNVTAGATTQVAALVANKRIRVCAFAISMSAAGTAQFVYGTGTDCGTGTTAITGAIPLATGTPLVQAAGVSLGGAGSWGLMQPPRSNALCVAAVTGNVVGYITYTRY